MKVSYTQQALLEIDEVLGYIAERSPQGADRVSARFREVAEHLARHPLSGSLTSMSGVRRIAATPYPYLIFYEPDAEIVMIIGVRHAARDPGSMPDKHG